MYRGQSYSVASVVPSCAVKASLVWHGSGLLLCTDFRLTLILLMQFPSQGMVTAHWGGGSSRQFLLGSGHRTSPLISVRLNTHGPAGSSVVLPGRAVLLPGVVEVELVVVVVTLVVEVVVVVVTVVVDIRDGVDVVVVVLVEMIGVVVVVVVLDGEVVTVVVEVVIVVVEVVIVVVEVDTGCVVVTISVVGNVSDVVSVVELSKGAYLQFVHLSLIDPVFT